MNRSPTSATTPKKTRRRVDQATPPRPIRATPRGSQGLSNGGPEWTTERWKRDVEAEARGRLKRNIRGTAAKR